MLMLRPINIREANAFVEKHHRTLGRVTGAKFAISVIEGDSSSGKTLGVVIVGRPVARKFDNGWIAEVTRLAVRPDSKNACSMLLGAARRACKAMGYKAIQTYITDGETAVSLKAAGWKCSDHNAGDEGRTTKRAMAQRVATVKTEYTKNGWRYSPAELAAIVALGNIKSPRRQRWAVLCF